MIHFMRLQSLIFSILELYEKNAFYKGWGYFQL